MGQNLGEDDMKALTLWQPWASVVALGIKKIENRRWKPPASVIGRRIAIHAGKTYDEKGAKLIAEICGGQPERVPFGVLMATARVVGVVTTPEEVALDQRRWFFGPYGWVLEDIYPCDEVEIKGAQGLWSLPPTLSGQLEAEAGRLAAWGARGILYP